MSSFQFLHINTRLKIFGGTTAYVKDFYIKSLLWGKLRQCQMGLKIISLKSKQVELDTVITPLTRFSSLFYHPITISKFLVQTKDICLILKKNKKTHQIFTN